MPALRDLLAAHAPLLLLDAASARVQVGWLPGADLAQARWESSEAEAGVGVFACVERLGVRVDDAGAFVFCHGPGSILGVRTTAMAVRTWSVLRPRPAFAYDALALVAHAAGRDDLAVIADARRDSWHEYRRATGLRRVAASALTGPLAMPDGFRHWSPLPPDVARLPYSLESLLPRVAGLPLFEPAPAPDAFLHEEPSYVTWQPQIHRAPS